MVATAPVSYGSEQNIAWAPQAGPQSLLITCPVHDVCYGGARGGGKTDALLGDWAFHADRHGEAASGVLFRKTYKEFQEIIKRSKQIYKKIGAKFNEGKLKWTMPGGSRVKITVPEEG